MGELTIRRNRFLSAPKYVQASKAGKTAGSSSSQKVSGTAGAIPKELEKLMTRVSQAESGTRESHRILQTGEGALDEIQDALSRAARLAQQAAGDGTAGRAGLQAELESLRAEIDRMLSSAAAADVPLFLDEDTGAEDGGDMPLSALMDSLSAGGEADLVLPDWLLRGLAADGLTPEQLLAQLGLDKTASGAELLAAIASRPPEDPAAARLAVLYLGAVIAGEGSSSSPEEMLEGLRQLLDKIAGGVSPDAAVEELTGGVFSSLAGFQEQFFSGTAPELQSFLTNLLLSDSGGALLPDLSLTLMAGLEGMKMDLLMELLTAVQNTASSPQAGPGDSPEAPAGTQEASGMREAEGAGAPAQRMATLEIGSLQVMGRDLSGVSFHQQTGVLTVGGTADVIIQGEAQEGLSILVTGSGNITLQNGKAALLTVDAAPANLISTGRNVLGEIQLREGASLTLGGSGRLELHALRASLSSALRLTGGAVVVPGEAEGTLGLLSAPVLLDGPVSLAAQAGSVNSLDGRSLDPFDIVWKTLLPGWSSITSLELEGKQGRLALSYPDPARLWLSRGDPSHGYPIYTLVLRGRDKYGQPRTRYAYLHWNQNAKAFQEVSMYPNPFTVQGGEPGKDWIYEEESHTLCILTNQVAGVSGGAGTDANQTRFSGRIALASGIGRTELSLGGVACRVASGRAFDLGRENNVALVLENGTRNHFESGEGCAGISLGSGTSLSIDCTSSSNSRTPAGSLTAAGGAGGAGIGRDSGGGRDQVSSILIQGGVITATGTGGGAGIGAGKHGAMGSITVLGGTVTSTGGNGGGAGIGGALGAPVGDINICGGTVSASAAHHAAAIGAGVQGSCGDIFITGTARIVKALGGNPGADIGACLFGGCGKVSVSGGADIGSAQLSTRTGIPLEIGADTVTLPQFRLSSKVLQLDRLDLSTQESARAAGKTIDAGQRWIAQIQAVYSALHSQLGQSLRGLYSAQQYTGAAEAAMRDTTAASTLLQDMKQSIQLQSAQVVPAHGKQGIQDIRRLLR